MKTQPLRQGYVNKQDGMQKLPEDRDEKLLKIQKDVTAGHAEKIKDDIGALLDFGYEPLVILRSRHARGNGSDWKKVQERGSFYP